MKKGNSGRFIFVDADPGKYLAEKGKENAPKLVRAIYQGEENIPEFEEKDLNEVK